MADASSSKDAAIHAEAIIAATLAAAVMVSRKQVYTQDEAIQQYKIMLNRLREMETFDPLRIPPT